MRDAAARGRSTTGSASFRRAGWSTTTRPSSSSRSPTDTGGAARYRSMASPEAHAGQCPTPSPVHVHCRSVEDAASLYGEMGVDLRRRCVRRDGLHGQPPDRGPACVVSSPIRTSRCSTSAAALVPSACVSPSSVSGRSTASTSRQRCSPFAESTQAYRQLVVGDLNALPKRPACAVRGVSQRRHLHDRSRRTRRGAEADGTASPRRAHRLGDRSERVAFLRSRARHGRTWTSCIKAIEPIRRNGPPEAVMLVARRAGRAA